MKTFTAAVSALLLSTASASLATAGDKNGKYKTMMQDQPSVGTQYGESSVMNSTLSAEQGSLSDEQSAMFDSMDTDRNRTVDFTEFSGYLETNYGFDSSSAAKEYVRLSDENGVITDMSFAGMDVKNLPHKHLDNGTTHNGFGQQSASNSMNSSTTMQQNTAVMGATTTSSGFDYGDFSQYDSNRDGSVDFREYSDYRSKSGTSMTRAAQEFIRFSNGNSRFTQSDFDNARFSDAMSRSYFRAN